ncbi:hypothetical protein CFI00_20825 [Nocardioides sp. S5]|uniref:hypothetical protein n=1 Tax=Nocardioides sp. S5 TaxID=2017486 RepID=UPI001A8C1500|nr:hypothetical protein [Nocardioides sp. S5]QSR32900.1 hypothetical protein CFI00_20825 [Nocardioides sp. S5]
MDSDGRTAGAWPARGIGPREGLRPGVRWPSRRDPLGVDGPTSWGTRSGEWRRCGDNLWVPASVDVSDPAQRIVEAAALLPGYGGVTGWAGLSWLGGVWFGGAGRGGELLDVPVAVSSGHRMRPRLGLEVSQEVIAPRYVLRHGGVRVTEPLWSVAYAMRYALDDRAAVVAFDIAAFNDLVSIDELAAYVDTDLVARRGVERVRRVLPELDENSWSPMEPVLRCEWREEMGRPRLLMNVPVFDRSGRFVGTPDAIDPVAGVYGMYDGGLHLAGKVRHADVAKEAAYRRLGLEGVTMMSGDIADSDPFRLRLRDAYARAGRRPASDREWTLVTPTWWKDTTTVAARRALSAYERRRLLAHRQRAA